MKKIAERFREYIRLLSDCRLSLGVLAATVLFVLVDELMDFRMIDELELAFIPVIGVLAFLGVFLSELALKGKGRWIGAGLAAGIAVLLGLLLRPVMYSTEVFDDYASSRIAYAAIGWGLILFVLIVYFAWRRSGSEFKIFTERSFRNCVLVAAASGIIGICVLALVLIVSALFDFFAEKALASMAILTFGFFTVPGCMAAVLDDSSEPGRFFRAVTRFILPIFEIAAILIGYAYGIRLLRLGHLPSNSIFGVVTALFVIHFFVWLIDDVDSEKNVFTTVRKWIPAAFLPLFFLQGTALFLRIRQYGFTPRRTIGFALVLFELTVIAVWLFRRRKLSIVLPILASLICILTILPVLNIPSVERWSAKMTWVGNRDGGKTDDWTQDYHWISLYQEKIATGADISAYSKLHFFSTDESALEDYDSKEGWKVDYRKVPVVFTDGSEASTMDLSAYMEPLIQWLKEHPDVSEEEKLEFCRSLNPVLTNEGFSVYITDARISIKQVYQGNNLTEETLSSFYFSGIVLE